MAKKEINIDTCCNDIDTSCNKIINWLENIEEDVNYMKENIWNGGKRSIEEYQNLKSMTINLEDLIENINVTLSTIKDTK